MGSGVTCTKADGVATVIFDNPPINLMTLDLFVATARLIAELAVDDNVRVVVLTSAHPDFFIAHFDVEAILTFPTDQPAATELNLFHVMCENLRTMPKATIAVIEGRIGGGGSELALSCDMRFAAQADANGDGAIFNQPEVALGIIPGGSGTQRLSRLMGRSRALEVILGCDDIDAMTAQSWGWVNRAMPKEELRPFVDRLARRIAGFPPHAVAAAKASVLRAEKDVPSDLLAEGNAFSETLSHPESRSAMELFLMRGGQTPEIERRLGALFDS